MSRILKDSVVTLAYSLLDERGNRLEDRTPENPLVYIHGREHLLPTLERILEGKTPGFSASIRLTEGEAYGRYRPELVAEIPRENFAGGRELRLGMKFDTVGPDKKPLVVRVIELTEKSVTLDGNHPLAGVGLVFDARVLAVREATAQELETGIVTAAPDDRRLH